jgi:hypothetical protein
MHNASWRFLVASPSKQVIKEGGCVCVCAHCTCVHMWSEGGNDASYHVTPYHWRDTIGIICMIPTPPHIQIASSDSYCRDRRFGKRNKSGGREGNPIRHHVNSISHFIVFAIRVTPSRPSYPSAMCQTRSLKKRSLSHTVLLSLERGRRRGKHPRGELRVRVVVYMPLCTVNVSQSDTPQVF